MMKKLNVLFLCWALDLVGVPCYSFNINVDHAMIYLDQSKNYKWSDGKPSYFGFSVILHPGDNTNYPWVQIGAPRSVSPTVKYDHPGIIFRCNIKSPCEYLEIDKEYGSVYTHTGSYINKLDGAWIGGVMDINLKSNRSVVCAPRWMNHYKRAPREDYRMLGACYWSQLDSFKYHKKIPLFDTRNDIYTDPTTNDSVYDWGQGESGFAVHMPENKNELLIGAPGVFNWKGTAIMYRDKLFNDNPIVSRYSDESQTIFSDVNVANSRYARESSSFGLFGYSVTSGYFYSPRRLHYAGGAPRSKTYKGQVLIYDFGENRNQLLNVIESKQGTQIGEYFGSSLAAGDINQDGLDDLFVGAPFHKVSKYNEGRMYLYLGSKSGSLQEPAKGKFVESKHVNAQFGTTITYLGDMNRDSFRYVAVSAPYEESSGVVYIFRGIQNLGLDIVPVQRIVGSRFLPNIQGFGISISKPTDIDGNGYKDIAIGAYKSGHVVILRSQPLIHLKTYFRKTPEAIKSDDKDFYVTLCHAFSSFRANRIDIKRRIVVDEEYNRAFLQPATSEMEQLAVYVGKSTCENVTIRLREARLSYDPLTIQVTHELIEEKKPAGNILIGNKVEGEDHFCQTCGVYDSARSVRTVIVNVPFSLGCGDENKCVSELEFDCIFNGTGVTNNTFILGAANVIDLETKVHNRGENAYLLRVQVDLPEEISLKNIPTNCVQNKTRITCQLAANPLKQNDTTWFRLRLDMDILNKRLVENFVVINVTLLTTSENKNNIVPFREIRLDLKTEADISISGKSGEQSYRYGDEESKLVPFEQIFQIGKYGLSPVTKIHFMIFVPLGIKTNSGNTTFLTIYQPEGSLEGGQSIIFYGNITYEEDHTIQSSERIDDDKSQKTRRKRHAQALKKNKREVNFEVISEKLQEQTTDSDIVGNQTFELNCFKPNIICGRISASTGPFDVSRKSAVVQLKMVLNTNALNGFMQKNAVIRFSSYAEVMIEDPPKLIQTGERPDMVVVSSLFVTESILELWIIIIAVISGLLLLLLLTLGLIKAGFFKRTKKEELEQLKAKSGMDKTNITNSELIANSANSM